MAIINYEYTVSTGLHESANEITAVGVAFNKGFELLNKASIYSTNALNNLAFLYTYGFPNCGFDKNLPKAVEIYNKALDLGDNLVYNNLGEIYLNEDEMNGFKKDVDKAVYYYKKGVEQNDSFCTNNLAHLYQFGYDTLESDIEKAVYYYKKAETGR